MTPRPFDRSLSLALDRELANEETSISDRIPDLSEERNWTDLGAARSLVRVYGENLRHVNGRGWHVWDDSVWRADKTGEVMVRAKDTAERLLRAAVDISDKKIREQAVTFALSCHSEVRLRRMIALATSEPSVPVLPDSLDADPWLLTCQNGTLDLRTGDLQRCRREHLITKMAGCSYDASATAPTWRAFLDRIMGGRQELIDFLRRACGYILSGHTNEQVLFMLYGRGANGKTTFLRVLLDLLGDYGRQAPSDVLLARRNDSHPTGIAGLHGARLVSVVEVDEGRRMAEGIVKQITGQDKVAARYMRQDFFEYVPTYKIVLACNHRPVVRGTDLAIWRRIRLIPFDVTIPPAEQDHNLADKLREELPGILRWCVEGALEWQRDGLRPPAAVLAATDAYRADSDTLGAFIFDRCTVDADAWSTKDELYRAFKSWSESAGEMVISKRRFGQALLEREGVAEDRTNAHGRIWKGVGLREGA